MLQTRIPDRSRVKGPGVGGRAGGAPISGDSRPTTLSARDAIMVKSLVKFAMCGGGPSESDPHPNLPTGVAGFNPCTTTRSRGGLAASVGLGLSFSGEGGGEADVDAGPRSPVWDVLCSVLEFVW